MLDECPTDVIAKAVRSNDWLERLAIATHPKAPPNTLKILCNDGNKWVRQRLPSGLSNSRSKQHDARATTDAAAAFEHQHQF